MRVQCAVLVGLSSVFFATSTSASGASPRSAPSEPKQGMMKTQRVFGPEIPTGRYKHPASITELANGDLYLVYYGGAGEYAVDTGVFGARLKKGARAKKRPLS